MQLKQLGLHLPDTYYLYVVCIAPLLPSDNYIYFSQMNRFPNIKIYPLVTDSEYGTLLILYHGEKTPTVAEFLACLCIDTETQLHTNLEAGYSTSSDSFANLPQLYEQATWAISYLQMSQSTMPILSYNSVPTKENTTTKIEDVTSGYSQTIYTMRSYIHHNYMHDITTKDIAAEVYLSTNYANSLFANECGMTAYEYLTKYRIDKAKILLTETDEYITKIAELVGYGSKTSFYLAFKRQIGMSPTEYRQRYTDY